MQVVRRSKRARSLEDLALSAEVRELNKAATPHREVPRSKYRNVATLGPDGQRYASKLEARCAEWLRDRKAAGEVLWFIEQVPFILEGGIIYRADFLAVLRAGGVEVIDATGVLTQVKAIKLKLVHARYGIRVRLWS